MAAWFVAWRILGGRRVGIGVGSSNFEIGLGEIRGQAPGRRSYCGHF